MDVGDWVLTGVKVFNEVGGVSVKVVGMATDVPQPSGKGMRYEAFRSYGLATVVLKILVGVM